LTKANPKVLERKVLMEKQRKVRFNGVEMSNSKLKKVLKDFVRGKEFDEFGFSRNRGNRWNTFVANRAGSEETANRWALI
jgi:hypothetical protein